MSARFNASSMRRAVSSLSNFSPLFLGASGELFKVKVMMRCTHNWNIEFFTQLDIPRKKGLKGLGNKIVTCPHCGQPHHLKRLYFAGDDPGPQGNYALDVAQSFAAEIGVLISISALIEGHLPRMLSKLTGISVEDANMTMGTFFNISHRLDLLQLIAETRPKESEVRKDILYLVKQIRKANDIRNKIRARKIFSCS